MSEDLRIDPERPTNMAETRIYVRARTANGEWLTADIGELDRDSLLRWMRAHGGAENLVLVLLGHEQILSD